MKFKVILILCLFISCKGWAQVKAEFEKERVKQHGINVFKRDLILLNASVKYHATKKVLDSLRASGNKQFTEVKGGESHGGKNAPPVVLIKPDNEDIYNAYLDLKDAGQLKAILQLPGFKVQPPSNREPANTIVIPAKTNPHQSYNDFYLGVIRNLMQSNTSALQPDGLTFAVYQSWEKEKNLQTEADIREYRVSFIYFLYKKYNF